MAHPSVRPALLWLCALGFLMASGRHAGAAQLYAADGLDVRLDNTLRYSAALRLESPSAALLGYANGDDGDRNFAPGLVSDRFDILSEFDIAVGDFGAHTSATAWYDTVYQARTDNMSTATRSHGHRHLCQREIAINESIFQLRMLAFEAISRWQRCRCPCERVARPCWVEK